MNKVSLKNQLVRQFYIKNFPALVINVIKLGIIRAHKESST